MVERNHTELAAEATAAYPAELAELCLFPGTTDIIRSQSYLRNSTAWPLDFKLSVRT